MKIVNIAALTICPLTDLRVFAAPVARTVSKGVGTQGALRF